MTTYTRYASTVESQSRPPCLHRSAFNATTLPFWQLTVPNVSSGRQSSSTRGPSAKTTRKSLKSSATNVKPLWRQPVGALRIAIAVVSNSDVVTSGTRDRKATWITSSASEYGPGEVTLVTGGIVRGGDGVVVAVVVVVSVVEVAVFGDAWGVVSVGSWSLVVGAICGVVSDVSLISDVTAWDPEQEVTNTRAMLRIARFASALPG